MEIKLNFAGTLIPGVDCSKPLMIAGPCSAETEEQVMEVALVHFLFDGLIDVPDFHSSVDNVPHIKYIVTR